MILLLLTGAKLRKNDEQGTMNNELFNEERTMRNDEWVFFA